MTNVSDDRMRDPGEVCKTTGCGATMLLLRGRTTKKGIPVVVCPKCDENPADPGLIMKAAQG